MEENFDSTCILTFDKTYKEFVNENRVDVFDGMSRSEYRCKYSNELKNNRDKSMKKLSELKNKLKNVEENNLSYHIEDPFTLLGFEEKTDVQLKIEKHSDWMKFYGNYAYSCSCGAGKTVAGIYLMYKKQCRTLIISSRNAVNDQWQVLIEKLYPKLIVCTKDGNYSNGKKVSPYMDPDVYIYSPQYLVNKLDIDLNVSLIIYDEVHSLLSKQFIKVLLMSMVNVINGKWSELPYMIALSATYPSKSTWQGREAINRINKIFGSVFKSPSNITSIPVKVWDYRDHYEREDRNGNKLTGKEALGDFDSRYRPLDDAEAVEYFCNKIQDEGKIKICEEYKGLVMTYSIDSSTYAALYIHKFWNCSVVLVRAAGEYCIFIEKDKYLDYEFNQLVTFKDIEKTVGVRCDYKDVIDKCCVVVGTIHRLKEGFSVQNIVWGICTKFVYNTIPRVQILGRIRRNSNH
ncbi:MAG: DEAD/DEAH box helicase, partial [Patescibacteria group bacterium]